MGQLVYLNPKANKEITPCILCNGRRRVTIERPNGFVAPDGRLITAKVETDCIRCGGTGSDLQMALETIDSPDADGRHPEQGDQKWTLSFPLVDGRLLLLSIGKVGFEALEEFITRHRAEDATPSGG